MMINYLTCEPHRELATTVVKALAAASNKKLK